MAIFRVELDQDTYEKLVALSFRECRPPSWQVEWLLRKAVQEEYDAGAKPVEPVGVGSCEQGES